MRGERRTLLAPHDHQKSTMEHSRTIPIAPWPHTRTNRFRNISRSFQQALRRLSAQKSLKSSQQALRRPSGSSRSFQVTLKKLSASSQEIFQSEVPVKLQWLRLQLPCVAMAIIECLCHFPFSKLKRSFRNLSKSSQETPFCQQALKRFSAQESLNKLSGNSQLRNLSESLRKLSGDSLHAFPNIYNIIYT